MFLVASALKRNPDDVVNATEDDATPSRSKMTMSWDLASQSVVFRSDDGEPTRESYDLEEPKVRI
jgi:hypothetical protein